MENLYAQTNVPPRAEPQKLETTERFNGYYNQEIAIDVQKYDYALAFFKASDFSLIDVLQFKEEDEQVGSYVWASNKRVVISINYKLGALESPISRGELFSVNFDLSKPSYIYGIRRETSSSKKTIVDKFSAAYLIDPLIEDPNHVLVAAAPFGQRTKMTILRLNIFNGGQKNK